MRHWLQMVLAWELPEVMKRKTSHSGLKKAQMRLQRTTSRQSRSLIQMTKLQTHPKPPMKMTPKREPAAMLSSLLKSPQRAHRMQNPHPTPSKPCHSLVLFCAVLLPAPSQLRPQSKAKRSLLPSLAVMLSEALSLAPAKPPPL